MAFNLMGGMQALANFGTGYMQEGRNEQQDAYNKVATQSAQLDLQQKQLQAKQAQQMSDDAIKMSIQQGQQAGKPPQQGQQGGQQAQPMDQVQQLNALGQKYLSEGNLTGAGQMWAQASTLANANLAQQQKQTEIKTADLTDQKKSTDLVTQILGGVTDQRSYMNALAQLRSMPGLSSAARMSLGNLPEQYDQRFVDHMVNSGMSASQKMEQQQRQLTLQNTQRHQSVMEAQGAFRAKLDAQRTAAYVAHQGVQKKAGATASAPTSTFLKELAPIVAEKLQVSAADPNITTPDPNSIPAEGSNAPLKMVNNTPAMISIASRTKELMGSGMPFDVAGTQATEEAIKNGQLQASDLKGKKSYTYHQAAHGDSQDNPIPLHGLQRQHLVKGKWYTLDGHTEQYTGQQ